MQAPKARRALPRRMKGTTMKANLLTTLVLFATFAVPAFADGTLGGCALIDKGGYSVKADPTCEFAFADDGQEDRDLADTDDDASTPSVRVGN